VVRRPACVSSAAGRRFLDWRDQLSIAGGVPRQRSLFPFEDFGDPAVMQTGLAGDLAH
jgi:hypothetical protein